MENNLQVSLVQSDIVWEDKSLNLKQYRNLLSNLSGKTDLAILPETFSTGFSMQNSHLAETNDGEIISEVKTWASSFGMAIAGSFFAKDEFGNIYNRGFFITPEGTSYFYDKRHLFRMGNEHEYFVAGQKQLIVPFKGWNISLIICYDLRFPVWSRNVDKAYDLLICCANWPEVRNSVWETLLKARAIENQAFVCGVNRIGEDGNQLKHQGNSMLINYRGEVLSEIALNKQSINTYSINKEELESFREKFPAWKDADKFDLL
ncbi:MAG: amidohydrolase [Dysgonamonadaceae bacterium]|jgi:predicted amidohydrolase|nr:amidohydrolase [Dysgonamonadaceae bacterium]